MLRKNFWTIFIIILVYLYGQTIFLCWSFEFNKLIFCTDFFCASLEYEWVISVCNRHKCKFPFRWFLFISKWCFYFRKFPDIKHFRLSKSRNISTHSQSYPYTQYDSVDQLNHKGISPSCKKHEKYYCSLNIEKTIELRQSMYG